MMPKPSLFERILCKLGLMTIERYHITLDLETGESRVTFIEKF